MHVEVRAFARARELLDRGSLTLELPDGATVADAWHALEQRAPHLRELAASTRLARNARMARGDEVLSDGDELALLPPVGGG
ncbi:MAG: MoaD/ThiS family protein [Vulcanimicrobiaceae bacterium]